MSSSFAAFERIVRSARRFAAPASQQGAPQHPFETRNISSSLPGRVRRLFDDGHFAQATFEAYKFVDKQVQRHARSSEAGFKLMMQVFGGDAPPLRLTPLVTASQQDEQKGYQFLFAGSMLAIRNPRGHEYDVRDDPDLCLDHLSFASMLLRRLVEAGFQ
ncbi:MAG: TIGR02391 family protein [Vicinamibacteria bacterium]